jgi:hypothetical protein
MTTSIHPWWNRREVITDVGTPFAAKILLLAVLSFFYGNLLAETIYVGKDSHSVTVYTNLDLKLHDAKVLSQSPSRELRPGASRTQSQALTSTSFAINWAKGITGDGKYEEEQIVSADRFLAVTCPSRTNADCTKVTVDPGDVVSSGERSEALIMTDRNGNDLFENSSSGMKYYALSIYIPSTWVPPPANIVNGVNYGKWGAFFQLHGPDSLGVSPAFAFMAEDVFSINVRSGDMVINKTNTTYYLSDGSMPKDKWVDFVVGINFASDNSGSITIWRHDQGGSIFVKVLALSNIATLQYVGGSAVGPHYWKTGYYRSPSPYVNQLYLGPQARGQSAAAVSAFAFQNVPELAGVNWNTLFN